MAQITQDGGPTITAIDEAHGHKVTTRVKTVKRLQSPFPQRRAICSCGWTSGDRYDDQIRGFVAGHLEEVSKTAIDWQAGGIPTEIEFYGQFAGNAHDLGGK